MTLQKSSEIKTASVGRETWACIRLGYDGIIVLIITNWLQKHHFKTFNLPPSEIRHSFKNLQDFAPDKLT